MTEEQRELYQTALNHFGSVKQQIKTIEECGELIQALSRDLIGPSSRENLIEELADVQIMIHQMSIVLGEEKFYQMIEAKSHRLSFRIAAEMNGGRK